MYGIDKLRRWWQIRTGSEETPFDEEAAAWLVSLGLHVSVLAMLAALTMLLPTNEELVLSASAVLPEEELVPEQVQFTDEMIEGIGTLSSEDAAAARAVAPHQDLETQVVFDVDPLPQLGEIQAIEFDDPISAAPTVAENVLVKGLGSVGATGTLGALDRITNEILISLNQRPTLVVWLFDQSGSLKKQRETIVKRFDHIYDELGVLEAAGNPAFKRHKDKPLLTVVASFGQSIQLLTRKPTDDVPAIKESVRNISDDPSGVENVFQSVDYVANEYRNYRLRNPRRNVMIVVFTDEAGDDESYLDDAVETCRKYQMPVYVVGVPAPFGRRDAFVKYVDPDPSFDQSPQAVPVHQGPESLLPERVQLALIGSRGNDDLIDSGFGPFGLSRLAYETGGLYFAVHPNRRVGGRVGGGQTAELASYMTAFFDPALMRNYRPNYVSAAEYYRLLKENRARAALVEASRMSWTTPLENVRLRFPKIDEGRLARDLSIAQRDAARLEPKINQFVEVLRQGEEDRPNLLELRWQAGYDLAMGRALATEVRAASYNAMLAQAKQGMNFKNEKSDTWILRPSNQITTSSALAKQAEEAREYLQRVVDEHQGTPWAMLAAEELQHPMGWEWRERFTDVAGRIARAQANRNRPRPPPPPQQAPKPRRDPPAL